MAAALAVEKKSVSFHSAPVSEDGYGAVPLYGGQYNGQYTCQYNGQYNGQYKSKYNGQNNSKYNGRYSGQHNGKGANTIASTLANTMANTRANTMARTIASTQHARPSSHVETLAVFGRPAPHRWSSATDFPCLRQLPPPTF